MAFKIASSPHLSRQLQTSTVMQRVLLCAMPALVVQCAFFGWGTLIQVILAMLVALCCEAVIMQLRQRSVIHTISDNSALLTAFLLGVAIPPLAPWWLVLIGSAFAIIIVKQLYGGLGQNLFNPAMAAYVLLLIAFPVQMTSWVAPVTAAQHSPGFFDSLQIIFSGSQIAVADSYRLGIDGTTMATPLDTLKTDLHLGITTADSLQKLIFNGWAGKGWFWVNLAYLAGGLLLLRLKLIRWHISAGVLGALLVCATIAWAWDPLTHVSPLIHLFSGATMIGAFFIATDPVTAATSNKGRLLFGAIIGVLVYLIRSFGGYPDAFAFAVLLANISAPLIDYYIKPRTYGHSRG
ncbi:electron transport complex subunit RsxD [Shewanella dokdonensis]|uniref:Ion-translocating oxidoreductase complex subunit D n=1 Tax=Shewanella dokdonensis TaxID=712036 RepID=A0ABX8DDZ9_9GAMM|nr:electron transport complex subunit RsxD [Shewanella dokdonensis]MCL1073179.1 electron transport complex subunit RsxD [Shewanella dokdonensis]QVK22958.1 electron transport complex subunit RsxD [Shewanella dokdonensis]